MTCFATLHHLDLDAGCGVCAASSPPAAAWSSSGSPASRTPADAALSLAAVPAAMVADRAAGVWEHGAPVRDPEHSYGEVRAAARSILPGARWRRRLYWRYSLVWQSPA